jgi:hypothetical protein
LQSTERRSCTRRRRTGKFCQVQVEETARKEREKPSKRPGQTGGFGKIPSKYVSSNLLTPQELTVLAYRSMHTDERTSWGCNYAKMMRPRQGNKIVSSGLSKDVLRRALKGLQGKGPMEREQGPRNCKGRGRGYAVDRLTFDEPKSNYVIAEPDLLDGSLTPSQITIALLLRHRGTKGLLPWQIVKRLECSRPTANKVIRKLESVGIAKNFGTDTAPFWALSSVKNSGVKRTGGKTAGVKTTGNTHRTRLSLTSVPHGPFDPHVKASPAVCEEGPKGTDEDEQGPLAQATNDLIAATNATFEVRLGMLPAKRSGMVMDREGREVRISEKDRKSIEALGGDVEELFDRAMAQKAKGKKPIGCVVKYMIGMAKNDAATALGTEPGVVQEIITGNTHARKAALAKATGGKPKPSAAVLRGRARTTAPRSDGAALMASLERLQQGRRPCQEPALVKAEERRFSL